MQMVVHFLCSDTNHSLNLAFIFLTTLATSEDKQKLNAMGIQLAELEAGLVRKKFHSYYAKYSSHNFLLRTDEIEAIKTGTKYSLVS